MIRLCQSGYPASSSCCRHIKDRLLRRKARALLLPLAPPTYPEAILAAAFAARVCAVTVQSGVLATKLLAQGN